MTKKRLFDGLEIPATFDAHVHLRDGQMMETVTPLIRNGGVDTVFVMPNLVPPITSVEAALDYQKRLQVLAPDVTFLMSLYLHPSITPDTISDAKKAGIHGVKSYPAGVTTNSSSGVVDYESFYAVFEAMQEHDLVLNLHGEAPPSPGHSNSITVLNAEACFLPTLLSLHAAFPRLRIILEHCTTASALQAVKSCGPTVAATITAHHLFLTVDDWAGDPFNFCKPVAKLPSDRLALIETVVSGNPKFFLGTDSAPHTASAKKGGEGVMGKCAAGVFTQPYATQLVFEAVEGAVERGVLVPDQIRKEILEGFLSGFGRKFYGIPESRARVKIAAGEERVVETLSFGTAGDKIVPFRRKEPIYSLLWI